MFDVAIEFTNGTEAWHRVNDRNVDVRRDATALTVDTTEGTTHVYAWHFVRAYSVASVADEFASSPRRQ